MFTLMFILLGKWLWKRDEAAALIVWFMSLGAMFCDYEIIKLFVK